MTTDTASQQRAALDGRTGRDVPGGAWVLVGVAAAVLGLLPWLVTGARLPLQNLWATQTLPGDMPLALLPFSQYHLRAILGMVIAGGAAAGIAVRSVRPSRRGRAATLAAVGFVLVIGTAVVQTTVVAHRGLSVDRRSDIYLAGLVALTCVSIIVAVLVLALLAAGGRPVASVAATLGALAVAIWLSRLLAPGYPFTSTPESVLFSLRWLPAVLVGLVLVWCGLGSVRHAAAWAVDLLLLWVVPAGLTAVSYALGSRVLLQHPEELVPAGLRVFAMALGRDGVSLELVLVAAAIAGAGILVRRMRSRADAP